MSQEMGPGDMKMRGELYPLSVGNLGLNVKYPGYIKYLCIDSCPIANKEDKTRFWNKKERKAVCRKGFGASCKTTFLLVLHSFLPTEAMVWYAWYLGARGVDEN